MRALKRQFPRLQLSFKTIHASKGLQADHVVLLNADSGRTGFPSEIVDDPLLTLVSPEEEMFENAEERRVMYVAMTRARFTLTLLASNGCHEELLSLLALKKTRQWFDEKFGAEALLRQGRIDDAIARASTLLGPTGSLGGDMTLLGSASAFLCSRVGPMRPIAALVCNRHRETPGSACGATWRNAIRIEMPA